MITLGPQHLGGPLRVKVGADEVISGTLVGIRHRLDDRGEARTWLEVDLDGDVVTVVAPLEVTQKGDIA